MWWASGVSYTTNVAVVVILTKAHPHYPTSLSFGRLVYDRETGKPKGYGFCEFAGSYYVPQISGMARFSSTNKTSLV